MGLGKPENHRRYTRAQDLHPTGLLGPTLEGSFSLVAGYGLEHYGRLMKDLGCAVWCGMVLYTPHICATPLLYF
jgi:hypothetical protein